VAIAHHLVDVTISIDDIMRGNLPSDFWNSANALASEPSVQCKTILSILAPLRHEQFGLLTNCLITGFACGLLLPWPTRFMVSVGFTGMARRAEIVILTISSVFSPSAAASPGDKSATR